MAYNSVVYRGYKLDPADASTYTFTSCDIGTESPLRAVLVGVVLGGTSMSSITANVTINGYAAARLGAINSTISQLGFFIARVPTGTSVSIVVQASAAGSARAAIAWYTFKPESLTPRDVVTGSATATTVTATDVDIVTNGAMFVLAYHASPGTSFTYTGTDSLVANVSNVQLETAVNAHFSALSTLTNQTIGTNDITTTGVSEPRSIIAVSFNTEAFFSDTVAESTTFAEATDRTRTTPSAFSDLMSLADIARDTPIASYADTVTEAVSGADTYTRVVSYPHEVTDTATLGYFASITENISASDVIRISDQLITADGVVLSDTVNTGDTVAYAYKLAPELVERLNLTPLVGAKMTALALVSETSRGRDTIVVARPQTVSEAVTLSHAISVVQATRIIERFGLSEVLLGPRKIGHTTAEAVNLSDTLRRFFGGDLVDGVSFSDAVSRMRRAVATSSEAVTLSETVGRMLMLRIIADESVAITHTQALKMTLSPVISEGVELSAAYVAPNGNITTWAINTKNAAVTEYSNYTFNSFAQSGHKYLGASSTGLYELNGDDDAGTDIIAQIKSGFAQFGGSRFTSFKAAYLGMRGEGDFVLKVETGDGKTYNYAVVGKDMETTKVHMGKGLRARYFAFELISTGQDFDLDDIEFMPLVAQRRV